MPIPPWRPLEAGQTIGEVTDYAVSTRLEAAGSLDDYDNYLLTRVRSAFVERTGLARSQIFINVTAAR